MLLGAACKPKPSANEPLYDNITIEKKDSLVIFYPNFGSLDLVCGSRVPLTDGALFCCAAAFTAECKDKFSHLNIRCNHVCDGVLYEGSEEPVCTGVFTFYDGQGHFDFANQAALDTAAAHGGMGFGQVLSSKTIRSSILTPSKRPSGLAKNTHSGLYVKKTDVFASYNHRNLSLIRDLWPS